MSSIFRLKDDLSNLPDIIDKYDVVVAEAEDDLRIVNKTLEEANREQPELSYKYYKYYTELKAMRKHADNLLEQKKGEVWVKVKTKHSIDLGTRDLEQYVKKDATVMSFRKMYLVVDEMADNFEKITKAFEARGYALKNITEARVHQLSHVLLAD
ncbi:MAG: recombination mediator protein UvsY [Neptunomonas phycophila]|uniref:recombination mediator protein UvsY n=1 Tax=Neptunomonas phycophila TaxID=1572645 RepID=UPI003B8BAE7F